MCTLNYITIDQTVHVVIGIVPKEMAMRFSLVECVFP